MVLLLETRARGTRRFGTRPGTSRTTGPGRGPGTRSSRRPGKGTSRGPGGTVSQLAPVLSWNAFFFQLNPFLLGINDARRRGRPLSSWPINDAQFWFQPSPNHFLEDRPECPWRIAAHNPLRTRSYTNHRLVPKHWSPGTRPGRRRTATFIKRRVPNRRPYPGLVYRVN